jgi:hypothetical protein
VSDLLAYALTAVLIVVAGVVAWWSIRRAGRATPQYPRRTVEQIQAKLDRERRRCR